MLERYDVLYKIEDNLYCEGSPVLIEAGQLLKDNAEQKVVAQLKFKSIVSTPIKALALHLSCKDVAGAELGDFSFQYLDIEVGRGKSFGSRTAIPLPDATTRQMECACSTVVFEDGSIWEWDGKSEWEPLPEPAHLSDRFDFELLGQYRLDTSKASKHEPFACKGLWMCACGALSRNDEAICESCGCDKATIFDSLDIDGLQRRKKERDDAEAEKRAQMERERQERLEEKKRKAAEAKAARKKAADKVKASLKKHSKVVLGAVGSLAIVFIGVLLAFSVVIPEYKYRAAENLMAAGEYDRAVDAFNALDGYRDSESREAEAEKMAIYAKAEQSFENGDYENAAYLFDSLRGFRDAAERAKEAQSKFDKAVDSQHLEKAKEYLEAGDFEKALEEFNSMSEKNAEAKELHDFARCKRGVELYLAGNVEGGIAIIGGAESKTEEAIAVEQEYNSFVETYGEWLGKWARRSNSGEWDYWIKPGYDEKPTLYVFLSGNIATAHETTILNESSLDVDSGEGSMIHLVLIDDDTLRVDYGEDEVEYHKMDS